MRWLIVRWLNRLKHRRLAKRLATQVKVGASTRLSPRFGILFAAGMQERRYVEIGEGGCVGAKLMFESNEGSITIGDGCYIASSVSLISRSSIRIGNHVGIAWGASVYDHDSQSIDPVHRRSAYALFNRHYDSDEQYSTIDWSHVGSAPIVIEDDAWIGFDAVILKGVTIGQGSIVAARSVVTKDVPPYSVVAGNPARVVKSLDPAAAVRR